MRLPQRSSLVAQVAEILRAGIHNGEWSQRLPSEVALCTRLQVSRRTLRAALSVLQREGFIKVRSGKGRDICAPSDRPPTGILASRSIHALTVFSHLVKMRKHLPRDMSLISRDDDEFLDAVTPSIARYVSKWRVHTKRLARAVLRLARTGTFAPRQIMFFPQFHKGETLAPPNS